MLHKLVLVIIVSKTHNPLECNCEVCLDTDNCIGQHDILNLL